MTDADIQYIGNWSSSQVISSLPAFVSGFVLTTTSSGDEDACNSSLTFSRNQSSVVHIGRCPWNSTKEQQEEGKAAYANPVMSRNHAKVVFSDSGTVSLVDTNSHHGTWVVRKSEDIKLTPDMHFRLEDGDKIRLGKEVVKDGIMHKPLVLSVKLLCNPSTPSARSKSFSISPGDTTRSSRIRNRFGLSSSSESESSSDSEEGHSDIGKEITCLGSSSPLFELGSLQSGSPAADGSSRPESPLREPLPPIDPGFEDEVNSQPPPPEISVSESVLNLPQQEQEQGESCTPPWRRFSQSPWLDATTNFFRHVPDILPRPFSRSDYLFGSRTSSRLDANQRVSDAFHSLPSHHHDHGHHIHGHHLRHHHNHNHNHHNHHNHHSVNISEQSNEENKSVNEDVRLVKEELQSLKTVVSGLAESHITCGGVRLLLEDLENRIPDLSLKATEEQLSSFKSSLKSIEQSIADFKQTITRIELDISLSNDKVDSLEKSTTSKKSIQDTVNDLDRLYSNGMSKWESDREVVKRCALQVESVKEDMERLRGEIKSLDEKVWQHGGHETMDHQLESRLKDYVNSELARLLDVESNSVLGKRKRSNEEEHVDMSVQTAEAAGHTSLTTLPLPPPKRMRINQYIIAGTIGALGTWLGLAYL